MRRAKLFILTLMKWLGLFYMSRLLSAKYLRILCYHGISLDDEHKFRGKLFMREELFARRMAHLKRLNYPVIGLDEAVEALDKKNLPKNAVAITFDDGWLGTFTKAIPVLQSHDFPVSIYVTSYFAEKQLPVMDVMLAYVLWKTQHSQFDLSALNRDGLAGKFDLTDPGQISDLVERLGSYLMKSGDYLTLISDFCTALEVNWPEMHSAGIFMLASPDVIAATAKEQGVNIELHSHNHRLPQNCYEECAREIMENRSRLELWSGQKCRHFCYPNGFYSEVQFSWLEKMGIKSATTVKAGLNGYKSNKMELSRFLDGENITDIEFEAELCGILPLLRTVKRI